MTKQCSLPKNLKTTSFSLKVQISTIFLGAPPPKKQIQQFPIYNSILSILNPYRLNMGGYVLNCFHRPFNQEASELSLWIVGASSWERSLTTKPSLSFFFSMVVASHFARLGFAE